MPERISSHDRPLISDLLNAHDMDPADLDALPRKLLRQSLRRLIDETGEPGGRFLWFPNQVNEPGAAPASERRPRRMERDVDRTDHRPQWPEPR